MTDVFKHQTRVYYDATDSTGVVYHSHYLNYIEHTRMEYWNDHGYDAGQLQEQDNLSFLAVECNMQWIKPARVADHLEITMRARDAERVSIWFDHEIFKIEPNGDRTLLNRAAVKMVCIDVEKTKARSIPEQMKEKFLNGE